MQNHIPAIAIGNHEDGYCSKPRASLPPIGTIEAGVQKIIEILKKEILCCHDVEDINKVYARVVLLERTFGVIPKEHNSLLAMKFIINKIKKLALEKKISPKGLISLYHLQKFSDKDLHINKAFECSLNRFEKNQSNLQELASHLPCCIAEEDFDEDVNCLLASPPSISLFEEELIKKKKGLRSYKLRQQTEAIKKVADTFLSQKKYVEAGLEYQKAYDLDLDDAAAKEGYNKALSGYITLLKDSALELSRQGKHADAAVKHQHVLEIYPDDVSAKEGKQKAGELAREQKGMG